MSRRTRLAPIRPSPTMPSCNVVPPFVGAGRAEGPILARPAHGETGPDAARSGPEGQAGGLGGPQPPSSPRREARPVGARPGGRRVEPVRRAAGPVRGRARGPPMEATEATDAAAARQAPEAMALSPGTTGAAAGGGARSEPSTGTRGRARRAATRAGRPEPTPGRGRRPASGTSRARGPPTRHWRRPGRRRPQGHSGGAPRAEPRRPAPGAGGGGGPQVATTVITTIRPRIPARTA